MFKIYGIHGKTQAIIKFPLNNGKAWLSCEFRHGRIGAGMANRPATYATTDETEQNIIENSNFFKTGHVFLYRSSGEESAPAAAPTAPAVEPKFVSEVFSREEAIQYLKTNGAKATNLKDDEAIKKYMAKINVEFPNFSF